KRSISRILIFETAVGAVLTDGTAPGVGKQIREAMRKTLGHLEIHRMVCRASRVRVHDDRRVLRIRDDEVIRESISCEQTAGLAGDGRRCVQSAGELTDVAVRKKCLEDGVRAESSRSAQRSSVDGALSQAGIRSGIQRDSVQ